MAELLLEASAPGSSRSTVWVDLGSGFEMFSRRNIRHEAQLTFFRGHIEWPTCARCCVLFEGCKLFVFPKRSDIVNPIFTWRQKHVPFSNMNKPIESSSLPTVSSLFVSGFFLTGRTIREIIRLLAKAWSCMQVSSTSPRGTLGRKPGIDRYLKTGHGRRSLGSGSGIALAGSFIPRNWSENSCIMLYDQMVM